MIAIICDEVVKYHTKSKLMCSGDLFLVYLEEIQSVGHRGVETVPSNVWRVHYEDREKSVFPFVRHYVNKERALMGFEEAIMFNGFLGIE